MATGALPRRNRPSLSAPLRGATAAGHHLEPQDLLEVALGPPSLFPSGAPTAGASPLREKPRPPLLCSVTAKDPGLKETKVQGPK